MKIKRDVMIPFKVSQAENELIEKLMQMLDKNKSELIRFALRMLANDLLK